MLERWEIREQNCLDDQFADPELPWREIDILREHSELDHEAAIVVFGETQEEADRRAKLIVSSISYLNRLLQEWPLNTVGSDEEIDGGDVVDWLGWLHEDLKNLFSEVDHAGKSSGEDSGVPTT